MKRSLLRRPPSEEDTASLIARTREATVLDSRVEYEDNRDYLPTSNDPMFAARTKWGWQHVEISDIIMSLDHCASLLEEQAPNVVLEGTRTTLLEDARRRKELANEWRALLECNHD